MIAQLTGTVADIRATAVVLDVQGVGFVLTCPPSATADMRVGGRATLYTHLAVREDALTLYGFSDAQSRDTFVLVQSVSGIGPKLAVSIVSHLTTPDLRRAILTENLVVLSGVPGVGKKTAQRLVLELKDRVVALGEDTSPVESGALAWKEQVILGLTGLGYSAKDAERAWETIDHEGGDQTPTVSSLMRAALQSLASR